MADKSFGHIVLSHVKKSLAYLSALSLMVVFAVMLLPYGKTQYYALILAGIFYLLDYIANERWRDWTWTTDKWFYLICILYWLITPLWMWLGIETQPCRWYVEIHLPFLVVGILGMAGMPHTYRIEWFTTVGLGMFLYMLVYILTHIDLSLLFVNMHTTVNVFNACRIEHFNTHMAVNMYANMLLLLGYTILTRKTLHKAWRVFVIVAMILVAAATFMTEGRVGFITVLLVMVFMAFDWFYHRYKKTAIVLLCVGLVAVAFAGKAVFTLRSENTTSDLRVYLWNVCWSIIKENKKPLLGYGPQTGHDLFIERGLADKDFYNNYAYPEVINNPLLGPECTHLMDAHNTFLQVWIAYGIVGLLFFLFVLFAPAFFAPHGWRAPCFMASCIYALQALFNNMGANASPLLFMIVIALMFVSARQSDIY